MKTLTLLAALLTAVSAQAAEYSQLNPAQSAIQFSYQQMGVKMDGKFRKFTGQLNFDPAKPASAKAVFDVELASIDAGSSDANQEVAGKAWFNSKAFPTARFVSTAVKPLGGNRYEVAGQLSIKGQTRDVLVPATFTAQGNAGVFDGVFTLRRGDFSIGEGAWAKFDIVANDVQVRVRLHASSK